MIILLSSVLCFLFCSFSTAMAKAARGDAPRCQEECLAHHSERMRQLSEEYSRTGSKIEYQDNIKEEVVHYSRCLTACREVLPVK